MTNLEIMNLGITDTTNRYMEAYQSTMSPSELDEKSAAYSAQALYKVINSPDGLCNDYTRKNNLRYDMAALGKDAIKNELLKNIVNVATYQMVYDTRAGNELGTIVRPGMTSEQIAVVVFNQMSREGVGKGYEMLNDPNVLFSACQTFAYYQGSISRRNAMNNIGQTNPGAIQLNDELDLHYARYGDAPKGVDTSNLESYGYDANGGFSGYGRK